MTIKIKTDGSSFPDGKGGWGVSIHGHGVSNYFGGFPHHTTSVQMELEAITKALELAPVGDRVIIETDCQACVRAFNGISKNQYVNNHFAHLREQHPNVELQLVKRKEVNIAHHLARKGAKSR